MFEIDAGTVPILDPKSAGSRDHKSVLAAHLAALAKVVCAIAPPLTRMPDTATCKPRRHSRHAPHGYP